MAIQGLCSDIFPIMENQIENEKEVNLKLEVPGDTGFKLVRLTCWFLGNKGLTMNMEASTFSRIT